MENVLKHTHSQAQTAMALILILAHHAPGAEPCRGLSGTGPPGDCHRAQRLETLVDLQARGAGCCRLTWQIPASAAWPGIERGQH